MTQGKDTRLDTLALHAGSRPEPATGARATPIYQSASFVFPDADHAASLFNMERAGYVYSRISNPTCAVLEERVAALEDGVGAIATASGQAALHLAIVTLMGAGSHIVASRALYGGSRNLLEFTLPLSLFWLMLFWPMWLPIIYPVFQRRSTDEEPHEMFWRRLLARAASPIEPMWVETQTA